MATKRDQRLAEQEKLRQTFKIDEKSSVLKKYLVWGGVGTLVLAGLVVFFVKAAEQPIKFDVTKVCLTSSVAYHWHPELTILINGEKQVIPANIGISPTCTGAIHTHATDGVIHVEPPIQMDVKLADFFKVWGQTFSKDQILNYHADSGHEITMTVDGQPSDAYENLVFKDKQKIVITYAEKK